MADNYDDYSREQLLRLLRERDQRPRFGLVWERDEIAHDLSSITTSSRWIGMPGCRAVPEHSKT